VKHPRILGIGTANPPARLTQEQTFHAAGYQSERIRKMFLNSDIDYRDLRPDALFGKQNKSARVFYVYFGVSATPMILSFVASARVLVCCKQEYETRSNFRPIAGDLSSMEASQLAR
jgi:hypothetical protein